MSFYIAPFTFLMFVHSFTLYSRVDLFIRTPSRLLILQLICEKYSYIHQCIQLSEQDQCRVNTINNKDVTDDDNHYN